MGRHFVNEVGTDLLLDTGVIVSDAVDKLINFQDPNGLVGSFAAELFSSFSLIAKNTGTYFLKRTLEIGDVSVVGEWRFQAFIANTAGTWWGETVVEQIRDQLEL